MEINLQKSLSELDKTLKPNHSELTNLTKKHNQGLVKKLRDFDNEDFRFMISQNTGLQYLIPLIIDVLEDNIFAEGDFYEGDLLESMLKIDFKFWRNHDSLAKKVYDLIKNKINFNNIEITDDIKDSLNLKIDNYINFYEEYYKRA